MFEIRKARLLIVDDSNISAIKLKDILVDDYDVQIVNNGYKCIDILLQDDNFDLITFLKVGHLLSYYFLENKFRKYDV